MIDKKNDLLLQVIISFFSLVVDVVVGGGAFFLFWRALVFFLSSLTSCFRLVFEFSIKTNQQKNTNDNNNTSLTIYPLRNVTHTHRHTHKLTFTHTNRKRNTIIEWCVCLSVVGRSVREYTVPCWAYHYYYCRRRFGIVLSACVQYVPSWCALIFMQL